MSNEEPLRVWTSSRVLAHLSRRSPTPEEIEARRSEAEEEAQRLAALQVPAPADEEPAP